MTTTLLFDLDDTLLETNTEAFLPLYYKALSEDLARLVPPPALMEALMTGVKRMMSNEDPSRTLQEVFEAEFYPRLPVPREQLQSAIFTFYESSYPRLREATHTRAAAKKLVDWARDRGQRMVVATDPLFPRTATLQRVAWAGLDPESFDLISSFETFHFTKSHPAYFAELLGRLGWPEGPAVMAGNDVERDLMPAHVMGLITYQVQPDDPSGQPPAAKSTGENPAAGTGDLTALQHWLASLELQAYTPPLKSQSAVLAMLRAAPATLHGLAFELNAETWAEEPSKDEWAMIELVCHLRDTEIEVHHAQIQALLADKDPFVPRPDAAVWAKQRQYLNEDGPSAIRQFAAARLETLARLQQVPDGVWSKRARHAIFGPTSFLEVVGFMADHDRMHLQQARGILMALSRQAHRN